MSETTAQTTAIAKFLTRYTLPGGPVLDVRTPTSKVRRLLAENPDERVQFMMESIGAACIARMELPAGYCEEYPDGKVLEFSADDLKETLKRVDPLTLCDQQAYHAAFEKENLPTKAAVEAITDAIKQRKAGK